MENQIQRIYRKSAKNITKEWNKYMERGQEKLSALHSAYIAAEDPEEKEKALKAYQKAAKFYTLENSRYKKMLKNTVDRLAHVNQIALSYVNDQMPQIYHVNYNQAINGINQLGIAFDIVDEVTIARRIKDGDIQLPYKKLDLIKDARWNTKQLNSSLLQGLLLGESIPKIAKRIMPIIGNNEKTAIRNARTMVTGAENQGRQDRYIDLESKGAVLTKVWIATHDGRVRQWHLEMDGQEVDIHKNFVDGNGNELNYPGDPSAAAETVYNCRCSMKSNVIGFKNKKGKIVYI